MHSITSVDIDPDHLVQLREWFVAEWGDVDSFDGTGTGITLPSPIVATEKNKLIGGLSFTSAPKPKSLEMAVWINAVLVLPECRRVGVGSQLIRAAEPEAVRANARELFVYTDVPELYEKLGWHIVETSEGSTVLHKSVTDG